MSNSSDQEGLSVVCSLISFFLIAVGVYELLQGDTAIAVMMFLAVPCSLAISWMTRKPWSSRARHYPETRKRHFPQSGPDRLR